MTAGLLRGRITGDVLLDGEPIGAAQAAIPVLDIGLQRGYGCFEALRSYGGLPFRPNAHYDRLAGSAEKLGIPVPERDVLNTWVADRSAAGGDCVVRVFLTGGVDPPRPGYESRVIVYASPLPEPRDPIRIMPVDAPWHADGAISELTGAKTLSYGPNLAASLTARRAGFDDALLIGRSGRVLEGPTYSVAWITGGVLEIPGLDLGLLPSITRTVMLGLAAEGGIPVAEGGFTLDQMLAAEEALAFSTVREITPIAAVGERKFGAGPLTQDLADAYSALVAAELGSE